MLRGGLVRAIAGIAADAGTFLTPLQGTSRNGSADVTPAMPHGRLRYDIRLGSARAGAHPQVLIVVARWWIAC